MSGSRLEKLGSIFSRTKGLLRSGVMPEAKKPLWYDVYAAFPPLREPVYQDPTPQYDRVKDVPVIPSIMYPEDIIRAKFYEVYGNGPRTFELSKLNFTSPCQRFVEKYNMLKKLGEVDEDKLFEETGKALMAEGLLLRRNVTRNVAPLSPRDAEPRNAASELRPDSIQQERQDQPQEAECEPAEEGPKGGPLPS